MKDKVLRVTMTIDYIVKVSEDGTTNINGWTIEEVIRDWYKNGRAGHFHASRESSRIGNSEQLVKFELKELKDLKERKE